MKNALIIAVLTTVGIAAQAPASTKATKKAPAAKVTAPAKAAPVKTITPQPLTIPKDAIAKPDGTYSWTDKQGKNWTFAKTPFGVMKSATSSTTDAGTLAGIRAVDAGDKVRFETPSPFGVIKREKSKSDLTDEERKLYDSQNPAANVNNPAPGTKQD